jgi:iron complex transport system permease protein
MITGPDHRTLLPASALAGACLLVLADTAARLVIAPTELPVGVVTAIIGVPFFISLLRKRHHYGMQ